MNDTQDTRTDEAEDTQSLGGEADSFTSLIRRKYLLALIILGIFALCNFSAHYWGGKAQEDAAFIINLSGRQRMLSQKIALLYYAIHDARGDHRCASLRRKLNATIDLMEKSHKILLNDLTSGKRTGNLVTQLNALYYEKPHVIDKRIKAYFEIARTGCALDSEGGHSFTPLDSAAAEILIQLDQVVNLYQKESEKWLTFLYRLEYVSLSLILMVLLGVEFLIFRPMSRIIAEKAQMILSREELYRKAKVRAEKATELKDQFVAMLAHDLRGPLSTVIGFLEHIQVAPEGKINPAQTDFIVRCVRSARQMATMIDELLDMHSIKDAMIRPKRILINAALVVAKVFVILEPTANQKKVTLVSEIDNELQICVDEEIYVQALLNLVNNAIKFSHPGGVVRVVSRDEDTGAIAVCDDGVGVDQDILGDLFSHDVKTTRHGSAGEVGTGLGLPLSNDIMLAHGGRIDVESKEGEGTVFILRLGS